MNESMLEATRLTRAGRLDEATALIQRALRGMHTPEAVSEPKEPPAKAAIEGRFQVLGSTPRARTERAPKATFTLFDTAPSPWRSLDLPAMPGARPHRPPGQGADVVPKGGRFIADSYRNQAGTRHYKLYIPSGYRGQALPLVVMLHGCTQEPDDFAAGTRMNHLAEQHDCLVLYPAQASSANPQRCWNWFKDGDQQRDQGEPSIIAGMTRDIVARYSLDRRRIYIAGLSSGGAMAAILGATHPDVYAAVGVHSGLAAGSARDLLSAFAAMRQGGARPGADGHSVPTIVFHGDRDATVHPRNGEQVIAHAAVPGDDGARVNTQSGQVPGGHAYTRVVYHRPGGQTYLEHWTVHGAGHAWAGGSPSGSYTDPKGPDATKEMLRFFYQHSLTEGKGRGVRSDIQTTPRTRSAGRRD